MEIDEQEVTEESWQVVNINNLTAKSKLQLEVNCYTVPLLFPRKKYWLELISFEWNLCKNTYVEMFSWLDIIFLKITIFQVQLSTKNTQSVLADAPVNISSILWFGGLFVFWRPFFQNFVKICPNCPYKLPCKIWTP